MRYTPPPEISIAVVMLHPGCNMTCAFCVTDNAFSAMTWPQATGLLDRLAEAGIRRVVLGGGEPLTWRPGAYALAAAAKERGFHVQMGTNGVALEPGFERHPAVDRFVLPLDAADRTVHEALREHRAGHFGIITNRLDALREAGAEVTVSTVVTRRNVDTLPQLRAFLDAYCAVGGRMHAWHLYKFVPEGRGGSRNAGVLGIDPAEYDQACDAVRRDAAAFEIYKRRDLFRSRTVDFFWAKGDTILAASQMRSAPAPRLAPARCCDTFTLASDPA